VLAEVLLSLDGIQHALLSEKLTTTAAFKATGDEEIALGGTMDQFSRAIDSGVRIAMMYGDRDYPLQHLSTTFIPGVFKVSRAGR
jgi:hypothetical protein